MSDGDASPSGTASATPMFPLGSVLLPGLGMGLHVFEPRYRRLVHDVMAGDGSFGIVLIERGSEVGGGDVRSDVGCRVEIVAAESHDDGRWELLVRGVGRFRVERWLDDDPYPRAVVAPLDDDPEPPDADAAADLERRFRRVCALASEAQVGAGPLDLELSHDPAEATFQIAGFGPFGAFDQQRVLATSSLRRRQELLVELLDDAELVIRHRLSGDGEG